MRNLKKIGMFAFSVFALFVVAFIVTKDVHISSFASGLIATASTCFTLPIGAFGVYLGGNGTANTVSVFTSERARATFEHQKSKFGNKKLTQSYLRLEAEIPNNTNVIDFALFEGDGSNVYATEKRLGRNDAFVVDQIGMFLLNQDVANKKTNGILYSYPNTFAFTPAKAVDLMALYHGKLQFRIGNEDTLIALDTNRFLQIPETQQTSAANYDQKKVDDGFVNATPNYIFFGTGTNEIRVQYPSYAGWAGAAAAGANQNRVVLILRGLLASGGDAQKPSTVG